MNGIGTDDMERGADWEREAVRERWAELERQRHAANRLLLGGLGIFAGVILLGLAVSSRACSFTPGGAALRCHVGVSAVQSMLLAPLGVVALGSGLWLIWRALTA